MVAEDAWLIALAGLACAVVCALLLKELKLLCFDEQFAASRGLPVLALDAVVMGLIVVVTIIGLQAVGLILMIAMLVMPAAAARFWTERMARMTLVAAVLGGLSGMLGSAASAVFPGLPSGAMIVLVAAVLFLLSLLSGSTRGVLVRFVGRLRLNARIDRQHLLRALHEQLEARGAPDSAGPQPAPAVPLQDLWAVRSWSVPHLRRQLRRAERAGLLWQDERRGVRLTPEGRQRAARLVHQHRLWELYLIHHADIAPGSVDRDADPIEHVLSPQMIIELESLLEQQQSTRGVADSPHPIERAVAQQVSNSAMGQER
jgi:manganese/zinc/iron transport system permease protein